MQTLNDHFVRYEVDLWSSQFPPGPQCRVLDLGAGKSPYRQLLERKGATVLAVDLESRSANTSVIARAELLPFSDAVFDAVLMAEVLEHVMEPADVIAEVSRVLREDGRLFVSTPLHYSLHEIPFDYFRPTEYGLSSVLERKGMYVERLRRRGGLISVAFTVALQLVTALSQLPARAPMIGRWYERTVMRLLDVSLGAAAFISFKLSSRSASTLVPLHELRGLTRALMLWTNGYCVWARKGRR